MTLKTLKLRATAAKNNISLPKWVSPENMSFAAYKCINLLKIEHLNYIETHNKVSDYKKNPFIKLAHPELQDQLDLQRQH